MTSAIDAPPRRRQEPAGRHRQLPAVDGHAGRERADAEEGGVAEGQLARVPEQQVQRQRGDGQCHADAQRQRPRCGSRLGIASAVAIGQHAGRRPR